jgi:single-stranded DNA-binding protein
MIMLALIVGTQAEHCAETLEAGDLVLVSGKLSYAGSQRGLGGLHDRRHGA